MCSVINGCNTGIDIANNFKVMYAGTFRACFTTLDYLSNFTLLLASSERLRCGKFSLMIMSGQCACVFKQIRKTLTLTFFRCYY
jgi:hypothetical protein